MSTRTLPTVAAVVGGAAAAVASSVAVASGHPFALLPSLLPVAWLVAGVLATRARPEHLAARLLLGVGVLHLAAFALASVVSVAHGTAASWWAVAVVGNLCYAAGFAALAALFAVFPDSRVPGRAARAVTVVASVVAPLAVLLAAVTSPALDLAVAVDRSTVPAPRPLPFGGTKVDLFGVVPLLVLLSLVVLVARARRASGERRRQLMWPLGAAGVLVLLLLATPAGTSLLGQRWGIVFVPIVGALPFVLLAGLVRYRLLDVDLYVGRTLAYGGVLVVVVSCYAGAAAVAGGTGTGARVAAIGVAVVAALTGHRFRSWLEAVVDRWLSDGRLRGQALIRHLAEALETADRDALAVRTAQTVATGLDVAWVRLRVGDAVAAVAGTPPEADSSPDVVVPLAAGGDEVGAIECGPRRGGWGDDDLELVRVLARHAALALHGADLAADLAARVDEVVASRARLVEAEDTVRRRVERDLHDGIQQQLVVLLARLELLRSMLDAETPAGEIAATSHAQARRSLVELRDVVRGIHPPLLGDRGLVAAVQAQVDQLPIAVALDVDPRMDGVRYAPAVEAAAYYVICEATTNVIKHSGAVRARVLIAPDGEGLRLAVVDEGSGFAEDVGAGATGLRGLRDRVEALGGTLDVSSTTGVGTTVVARLPGKVPVRV